MAPLESSASNYLRCDLMHYCESKIINENKRLKTINRALIDSFKRLVESSEWFSDIEKLLDLEQTVETEHNLQPIVNRLEDLIRNRTTQLSAAVKKMEAEEKERQIFESALCESERKYRELVECANSIILRLNKKGEITFFNEYAQKFFGYTEIEILGKNVTQTIVPPEELSTRRNLSTLIDTIFNNPQQFSYHENENLRKTGERVWIAWNNRPIFDATGNIVEMLCVGTDITTRKTSEEALRESERKYRYIFEESPAGCIIIGSDGLMKEVNKTFIETLGYRREELIGQKALEYVIESQRDSVAKRISSYFNGQTCPELDVHIFSKNRSIRVIRFSGRTALLMENGQPYAVLISGVDVTSRLQMEMLNAQNQRRLVQADKMATLGVLVSGVAHEINNPNNFILLNSNNILDIWKDLEHHLDHKLKNDGDFFLAGLPYSEIRNDIKPLISGISEGAERIRRIVQSLKDFARKDPGNLDESVDVNAAVENSVIILSNLLKKSTNSFKLQYGSGIPVVRGNFQQIEQVIINLINNACQALTCVTQGISLTTFFDVEKNNVIIEVHDEGKGILPEHLKYIFDPFFTTKRDYGGTGLGLSISYKIIKDHRGELIFDSACAKGTTARIELPAYQK